MLKGRLLIIAVLWASLGFSNSNLRIQSIKFQTGATTLSREVIRQASKIYNNLSEKNFAKIQIKGEGEEHWSRLDIIQLGKKRARSIRDFYVGIGCQPENIKLDYNGVPQVILFKPKAIYSISGKIDLNSIEQQCFTIKGDKPQHFKTKYGNVFVFEPGTFVDKRGIQAKGEISLCLWEFAKKKDMIKGAVASGGRDEVLETASTFFIQGYQDEKELKVNGNKSFKIYLKRPKDARGYQAYYGDVKNGNVSWKKDARSYTYTSMFDEGAIYEQMKKGGTVKMKMGKSAIEPKEAQEHLLLNSKKIGWVNCDRIVNVRKPCNLKLVLDDALEEYNVRLVFQKRNVVVPGLASSNYTNHYSFNKVPSNETAYVIAYRKEGGEYSVAYSQVTLGFVKQLNLKPETKSESEFNSLLESFLN